MATLSAAAAAGPQSPPPLRPQSPKCSTVLIQLYVDSCTVDNYQLPIYNCKVELHRCPVAQLPICHSCSGAAVGLVLQVLLGCPCLRSRLPQSSPSVDSCTVDSYQLPIHSCKVAPLRSCTVAQWPNSQLQRRCRRPGPPSSSWLSMPTVLLTTKFISTARV